MEFKLDSVFVKIDFEQEIYDSGDFIWAEVSYKHETERGPVESVSINTAIYEYRAMSLDEIRQTAIRQSTALLKSAAQTAED